MAGISLDTPLAETLSNVVQNKITEIGWGQEDDTSLAEYIVLMLANGKTQEQISSELAGDLLQDGDGIPEFAQWLFDQVKILRNGGQPQSTPSVPPKPEPKGQSIPSFHDQDSARSLAHETFPGGVPAAYDADMGDCAPDNAYVKSLPLIYHPTDTPCSPRGPKGMHGGRPAGRGGRMMGQLNKAMDRSSEAALHRVRGNDRINSHLRGAPKGPRNTLNRDVKLGVQKTMNGMGMGAQAPVMPTAMMQSPPPGQQPMMPMSPQQQFELMAMMEQQARMMAQFMPGMMQQQAPNPALQQPNSQGRSLFERVEVAPGRGRASRGRGGEHQTGAGRQDRRPSDKEDPTTAGEDAPTSSMEVEQPSSQPATTTPSSGDPSTTMCRYNLRCTNRDCPYVHQSPAAPANTTVDMSDTCTFGAACKSSKCVARHPSPALKQAHQAEELCKFWPYCSNPICPFKHPSMPMCRNGANCTVPHCKFTHLQTACKFNPCMNARCPYKHVDGQRAAFQDKVWVREARDGDAEGNTNGNAEHVSERKFAVEGEEELVRPEMEEAAKMEELIT